jgi:hypothetical protein
MLGQWVTDRLRHRLAADTGECSGPATDTISKLVRWLHDVSHSESEKWREADSCTGWLLTLGE